MAQQKFSGHLANSSTFPAVTATQYHSDPGARPDVAPVATAQKFVPPSCTVVGLTVNPITNTTANTTTFTVYKNGVATAVTLTVAAGSTTKVRDVAHTVTFNGTTDYLDLVSVRTGSLATSMFFGAVVESTIL